MTLWEVIAVVVRILGWLFLLPGLWWMAGGVRLVVSGRIDERNKAATSLKRGLPFMIIGVLLLIGASWISP